MIEPIRSRVPGRTRSSSASLQSRLWYPSWPRKRYAHAGGVFAILARNCSGVTFETSAIRSFRQSAHHIARNVAAHPVERRAALIEKLMRVHGHIVILLKRVVRARVQRLAGRLLPQVDSQVHDNLNGRRFAAGRIENNWIDLRRIDAARQNGVGIGRVFNNPKSRPGCEFSANLLRQNVNQADIA